MSTIVLPMLLLTRERLPGSASDRRGRIAFLFHESEILGAGVSVLRALPELERLGWESSGWFPGPGPLVDSASSLRSRAYKAKPLAVSVQGWRRSPGLRRRLRETPGYMRALREWLLDVRPDVVHANSLLMLPEATVARSLGLPVVLQVHELPTAGRKRDFTLRCAAAVADVLVGVSHPVSEMLSERAGRTHVVTVYNGVSELPRAGEPPVGFVVGSVGHVSRTKGTDIFLEAAGLALKSRPRLRFEHIGPPRLWGDDDFDRFVERLAASPSLADSVFMLGRRSVQEGLRRWNVLVLPSRQDAFPLTTLEAMAAGVPVIAAAVGGIPEQIIHGESGILVPPERPEALAAWAVRLHDDADLRSRLGTGGQERVRQEFTLQAQAAGLSSAYERARTQRRHAAKNGERTRLTDAE